MLVNNIKTTYEQNRILLFSLKSFAQCLFRVSPPPFLPFHISIQVHMHIFMSTYMNFDAISHKIIIFAYCFDPFVVCVCMRQCIVSFKTLSFAQSLTVLRWHTLHIWTFACLMRFYFPSLFQLHFLSISMCKSIHTK